MDLGFATLTQLRYPGGLRCPSHAHDFSKVSLLVSGNLRERVGGREVEPRAGSLVVKPAGVEHSDEISPEGAQIFSIRFAEQPGPALAKSLVRSSRYGWGAGGAETKAGIAVFRAFRQASPMAAEDATLFLLGALGDRAEPRRDSACVAQAVELLHDGFAEVSTVREVAEACGVHPVYLTRVFRKELGCSVSSYLRRLRVQAAMTRIAAGTRLADVAIDVGFSDQPHLCRVFKQETGVTPGAWAKLTRA